MDGVMSDAEIKKVPASSGPVPGSNPSVYPDGSFDAGKAAVRKIDTDTSWK